MGVPFKVLCAVVSANNNVHPPLHPNPTAAVIRPGRQQLVKKKQKRCKCAGGLV